MVVLKHLRHKTGLMTVQLLLWRKRTQFAPIKVPPALGLNGSWSPTQFASLRQKRPARCHCEPSPPPSSTPPPGMQCAVLLWSCCACRFGAICEHSPNKVAACWEKVQPVATACGAGVGPRDAAVAGLMNGIVGGCAGMFPAPIMTCGQAAAK